MNKQLYTLISLFCISMLSTNNLFATAGGFLLEQPGGSILLTICTKEEETTTIDKNFCPSGQAICKYEDEKLVWQCVTLEKAPTQKQPEKHTAAGKVTSQIKQHTSKK
jgi:hypothetical protein